MTNSQSPFNVVLRPILRQHGQRSRPAPEIARVEPPRPRVRAPEPVRDRVRHQAGQGREVVAALVGLVAAAEDEGEDVVLGACERIWEEMQVGVEEGEGGGGRWRNVRVERGGWRLGHAPGMRSCRSPWRRLRLFANIYLEPYCRSVRD